MPKTKNEKDTKAKDAKTTETKTKEPKETKTKDNGLSEKALSALNALKAGLEAEYAELVPQIDFIRAIREELPEDGFVVGESTQLFRFTTEVKNNFSYQERVELVETLWRVIYADGKADEYESQLMRRICGLIYVTDRDSGLARKRVRSHADAKDR